MSAMLMFCLGETCGGVVVRSRRPLQQVKRLFGKKLLVGVGRIKELNTIDAKKKDRKGIKFA